ncbi:hypothetical protein D3C85_1498010 [compost metagenome]
MQQRAHLQAERAGGEPRQAGAIGFVAGFWHVVGTADRAVAKDQRKVARVRDDTAAAEHEVAFTVM